MGSENKSITRINRKIVISSGKKKKRLKKNIYMEMHTELEQSERRLEEAFPTLSETPLTSTIVKDSPAYFLHNEQKWRVLNVLANLSVLAKWRCYP